MSKVIRLSADVFDRLQRLAEPLVDSTNDVIERLLDFYESGDGKEAKSASAGTTVELGATGTPSTAPNIPRTRNSSITEAFLAQLLLVVLLRLGGAAQTRVALDHVRNLLVDWDALRPVDLEISSPQNGWERWETNARFARKRLVEAGLLWNSVVGQWELTDKGREEALRIRSELGIGVLPSAG